MKCRYTAARGLAAVAVLSLLVAGCGRFFSRRNSGSGTYDPAAVTPLEPERGRRQAATDDAPPAERRPPKETVPASPRSVRPRAATSVVVWRKAMTSRGTRIVVSVEERALWVMRDSAVVFRAPVAVGMHEGFTYRGKRYDFRTPVGQRKVLAKAPDPIWKPPDWHYYEKVVQQELEPVQLALGSRAQLADGSFIEVRGDQVGRVNPFGNFAPFTPGNEIVFDGKIFIPPHGTAQRQIPLILGTRKLEIGDGYLIHGTPDEFTIGEAVSHGCVRMYNDDVMRVYEMAPVGTAVFIY
ncbi:MAG: L,D-transpeptidase [Longimicrobiales bacterium]